MDRTHGPLLNLRGMNDLSSNRPNSEEPNVPDSDIRASNNPTRAKGATTAVLDRITLPSVQDRIRTGLFFLIGALCLHTVVASVMGSGALVTTIQFARVFFLGALLAALRQLPHRATGIAIIAVAFVVAVTTGLGVLSGEVFANALLSVVICWGAAALLPWGAAAQAVTATITLATLAIAIFLVIPEPFVTVTPRIYLTGLLTTLATIPVAAQLARGRRLLETLLARARSAEAEIIIFNRDLDDRVRDRTVELHEANEGLAAFTYSVSHDLRSPLRAVSGYSQMLLDEVPAGSRENLLEHAERIQAGAIRMGHLIDALLTLGRVGHRDIERQSTDLSTLAAEVGTRLQTDPAYAATEFIVAPGMEVYADAALVATLLENLLGNAFKFCRHQAQPKVEVGEIDARGVESYFVRDNGTGFDMRFSHNLFVPFRRLHTDQEFEGTGIGLAIVDRIVSRHQGRVWADSTPGTGATLYFSLQPR